MRRALAIFSELKRLLWRGRLQKAAITLLLSMVAAAIFADFLASDLPIALHFKGETYVLPNVRRPAELRAYDNQRLLKEMSADDWAWMPLCRFGPTQHPTIVRPPPASPDGDHWLGTDDRGRDVFARLVHGTRVSLSVGFISVALYVAVGVFLGLLAGFYRGRVDALISRLVELGLTFPTFFLILTVMALLERTSLLTIMIVIGSTRWTEVCRLVRAEVLRLRELDFIIAARAMGAGPWRIMLRHLLPNAMGPVVVNATFGVAGAILTEAALTFLGFGAPPPTASWGEVLGQAYEHQHAWWLVLLPGLMVFLTVVAINVIGEGLRDALDPRRQQEF